MSSNRPAIVIDLDGTILRRTLLDGVRLYFTKSVKVGQAFGEISGAIGDIARKFDVIAVTARAERAKSNTFQWLVEHGLGFVELYHSPVFHLRERTRAAYKTSLLKSLRDKGYDLRYGMGDRPSDFISYVRNGLFPIVVLRPHQRARIEKVRAIAQSNGLAEDSYRVIFEQPGAPAWTQIAAFILERASAGIDRSEDRV
jgi:hypothetical protein